MFRVPDLFLLEQGQLPPAVPHLPSSGWSPNLESCVEIRRRLKHANLRPIDVKGRRDPVEITYKRGQHCGRAGRARRRASCRRAVRTAPRMRESDGA